MYIVHNYCKFTVSQRLHVHVDVYENRNYMNNMYVLGEMQNSIEALLLKDTKKSQLYDITNDKRVKESDINCQCIDSPDVPVYTHCVPHLLVI